MCQLEVCRERQAERVEHSHTPRQEQVGLIYTTTLQLRHTQCRPKAGMLFTCQRLPLVVECLVQALYKSVVPPGSMSHPSGLTDLQTKWPMLIGPSSHRLVWVCHLSTRTNILFFSSSEILKLLCGNLNEMCISMTQWLSCPTAMAYTVVCC